MSSRRLLIPLIAVGSVTLIAAAATELFVVRDLLAALLMFYALIGVLGVLGLVSYLLGEAVVRCFAACAVLFRFVGRHSQAPVR